MRCWALELGVDGFRFDLGIALSRSDQLKPLNEPPLFAAMEADPQLSDLKLVSEPWDCGGLYRLDDFPAKRIGSCLLYTSPSPRDRQKSRMPSSA